MISFKAVPVCVKTQLHKMLPLLEAMVQITFCKIAQEFRHFYFHFFYRHERSSFENGFDLWKKEEVAGIRIRRIREVSKHSDVFTG